MSASQKTYLVTGSNKGLGFGIVSTILAKSNDAFVVAAARNTADATDLHALKKTYGDRIELVDLEVTTEASVKAAAEKVASLPIIASQGLDVLVPNAGVSKGGATGTEFTIPEVEESLAVNFYGLIHTVNAFLPLLRKGQGKRIIYTSSGIASNALKVSLGRPGNISAYGISKAAANHYLVRLAAELAEDGFNVIMYQPGVIRTAMTQHGVDFPFPLITIEEAGAYWYERFVTSPPQETGSFIDEKGNVLPW